MEANKHGLHEKKSSSWETDKNTSSFFTSISYNLLLCRMYGTTQTVSTLCECELVLCAQKKANHFVWYIDIKHKVLFCFVLFFSVKENQFSFIFKFIKAPFGGRLAAMNLSYRDFMNDQDFVMQCRSKVVDRNNICLRKLLPSLFIA